MDCTRFTSACNKLSISGYPTIIFFRQGRRIEYHGERTKEALYNFVVKSSAPIVEKVNAVRLNDIRKDSRNDPAFVIIGDEKDELQKEFETIADSLFSKTRFFSASPIAVPTSLRESGARIAVFKDDAFFPYHGTVEGLKRWVMAERWSLMPRATPTNIAEIGSNGKLTVLVVCTELDRLNQSSPIGIFCEMVGPDLLSSGFINIMVFNYSTYEFYLSDDEPQKMTRASIVTWLNHLADAIEKNTAAAQGGRSWPIRIKRMIYELYTNVAQMFATQPLLSSCLFGVPIAFLSIICYRYTLFWDGVRCASILRCILLGFSLARLHSTKHYFSICSADFTVDRDEFYPEDEDEDYDEAVEEDERAHLVDPNHPKNE
ncbi:unnamed protein product [Strongylus vulgaris]|uniref:Thioredoxin domain-containing protein n=1 Tax=Strongylus vulgaris TaxID=40348 RepID=A0A3P7J3A8_STRVU|nr:unnamed protein product [Strongylus vulgaris]